MRTTTVWMTFDCAAEGSAIQNGFKVDRNLPIDQDDMPDDRIKVMVEIVRKGPFYQTTQRYLMKSMSGYKAFTNGFRIGRYDLSTEHKMSASWTVIDTHQDEFKKAMHQAGGAYQIPFNSKNTAASIVGSKGIARLGFLWRDSYQNVIQEKDFFFNNVADCFDFANGYHIGRQDRINENMTKRL